MNKILLLNIGYCRGIDGSIKDYLTKFTRLAYLTKKQENETIKKYYKIIEKEKPDLICLIEIEKGEQFMKLIPNYFKEFSCEEKYGETSILRKLPFHKGKSNGIISKEKIKINKKFLKYGSKKLIYEVELNNGFKLVMGHFSLVKKTRRKQFDEINDNYLDKTILCGDFNIFSGEKELDTLSNFKLIQNKNTFPAYKPKRKLDLFMTNSDLNVKTKVIEDLVSDHLGVILELK